MANDGQMEELGVAEGGGGTSWVFYLGVVFGLVVIVGCSSCILGLFCVAKSG